MQLLFADEGVSTWEWLRRESGSGVVADEGNNSAGTVWQPVSSNHVFVPGPADVGHVLKIRSTPAELR